jgi:hypothetical protein
MAAGSIAAMLPAAVINWVVQTPNLQTGIGAQAPSSGPASLALSSVSSLGTV